MMCWLVLNIIPPPLFYFTFFFFLTFISSAAMSATPQKGTSVDQKKKPCYKRKILYMKYCNLR